jgi:hypothetical protein
MSPGARAEAAAEFRHLADLARAVGSPALYSLLHAYARAAERGDLAALTEARSRLEEDCRFYGENAPDTLVLEVVTGALRAVLRVAPRSRRPVVLGLARLPNLILRVVHGQRRVVRVVTSDEAARREALASQAAPSALASQAAPSALASQAAPSALAAAGQR